MGYEDSKLKAVADKKTLLVCAAALLLCIAIYVPGKLRENKGAQELSALQRGIEKRTVELHAVLSYQGEVFEAAPELTVQPQGAEGTAEEEAPDEESFLSAFSEKLFRSLSKNSSGAALELPSEEDGVSIKWTVPAPEAPSWVFGIYILAALFLWFSRYDSIKAKRKADKEALVRELPNAILQLCLLLNSGLKLEPALKVLAERGAKSCSVLSKCFIWLKIKAQESNSSFVREMHDFSKSLGNREFLRFSMLCMENIYHGSELASKLEAERSRMWEDRLSNAKAAAKLAETKLCFPLMLMLIALLIICTLPAMSGM